MLVGESSSDIAMHSFSLTVRFVKTAVLLPHNLEPFRLANNSKSGFLGQPRFNANEFMTWSRARRGLLLYLRGYDRLVQLPSVWLSKLTYEKTVVDWNSPKKLLYKNGTILLFDVSFNTSAVQTAKPTRGF